MNKPIFNRTNLIVLGDLLVIAAGIAYVRNLALSRSAERALHEVEPQIRDSLGDLRQRRQGIATAMREIGRAGEGPGSSRGPVVAPSSGALPTGAGQASVAGVVEPGTVARLGALAELASLHRAESDAVRAAERFAMRDILRAGARRTMADWRALLGPLDRPCLDRTAATRVPDLVEGDDLGTHLVNLARVQRYGQAAARTLQDCAATIPVRLTDEDLTFKFGSARELAMSWEERRQAIQKIHDAVDDHPEHRTLYVSGHTDYVGGIERNLTLSQGRAEFVAAIVRRYLTQQALVEGSDFRILIERRGSVECPTPTTEQQGIAGGAFRIWDETYRRRCRKIVLRFQRGLGFGGSTEEDRDAG